ncbi:hypothetical protein LCGC14_2244420, partial [marine sediment metagenome]
MARAFKFIDSFDNMDYTASGDAPDKGAVTATFNLNTSPASGGAQTGLPGSKVGLTLDYPATNKTLKAAANVLTQDF